MNKFIFAICFILCMVCSPIAIAEEPFVLKTGVAVIDNVPSDMYGTWRVTSTLYKTTTPGKFNKISVDIWTMARMKDFLNVSNPLLGASTNVNLKSVKGNTIRFFRTSYFDGNQGSEDVTISVSGNHFWGIDKITVKKLENGKVIGQDIVEYNLKGEKISGSNIF